MSSFLEIRNVVSKEIDLNKLSKNNIDRHYYLAAMYFAQLVYFRWSFVEQSLTTLPGYVSHKIYDVKGTQAYLVEFDEIAIVSFRGTESKWSDLLTIFTFWQTSYKDTDTHRGFLRSLDDIRDELFHDIMAARVSGKRIHFFGHSMGGALATLAAIDHKPETCCVFGSPRVLRGSYYKEYFMSFPFIRVENQWDLVTRIPFSIRWLMNYNHVGTEVTHPSRFSIIKNHFITRYLRASLDVYYAESTGLKMATYDPKELKKQITNSRKKGYRHYH